MGFLSAQYRQQIDDEQKKQTTKPATPSKSKPDTSVAQKAGGLFSAVGRAVFKNTAKFVNQTYQEGKQVVDTSKLLTAQATGNEEAFTHANEQSQKDYQGFKDSGGIFNAGTFNTENEAKKGDVKAGVKKIGAGTAGVATEVIPFARGAGVAARGAEAGADVSRTAKAIAAARLLGEGAGYGVANSAVDSVTEDKPLSGSDLAKSALIGAGSAGLGAAAGKTAERIINRNKVDIPTNDTPNFDTNELDILLPTKIPVNQIEDAGTVGKIGTGIPETPQLQPHTQLPISDTDFRLKFKSGVDEAAKLPQMADSFSKTGSKDSVKIVLSNLADAKSTKPIARVVAKLVPDLTKAQNRELAAKIKDTTNEESVKELLNAASQNTQATPTAIAPATKISFDNPDVPQSNKFSNALVNNGEIASTEAPIGGGDGYNMPPLTIGQDTRLTTPQDAQATIAAANVDNPTIASTSAPISSTRAQAALVSEPSISILADAPTTDVGKGAQSIAKRLDDQLSTFNDKYKAPDEIIKKLEGNDAVSTPARSNDWLDHYEDTLGVLGRHFGNVGTDLGYKLAEGAKQVADLQETVRPAMDKAGSLLDKIAKSKSGRAEVQGRIYDALENRDNVDNILQSKQERELYDQVVSVFDYFKQQRIDRGKSVVGEDYSPRTAVRNALDAPDKLLDSARTAFSKDVSSKFSKTRVSDIPDAEINRNIVDLLPTYVSSQSKEFGYEGAMKYAQDNLKNVNPAYLTDGKSYRQGETYLRNLFQQVLDPRTLSKSERLQNKLIANTYRNQLGFSLKYAAQNLTQRFSTMANVSREARKVAGQIDKADLDLLRKSSFSGDATISTEALQSGENTLGSTDGKLDAFFKRFDPGMKTEKSNVHNSFDLGATQAIVESQPYKDAIKSGLKPADAAKHALQDETVKDLAIRRGNVVTNDTQFSANFVTKPEFFRNSGTLFGISDKWFKQYQRFPQGMIQQVTTILKNNDARALDILRRGNPAETNLVDYRKSAEALHNGVTDIIQGIQKGEIHDVSLEVAKGYQKSLSAAIKELNKQMEAVSQSRGKKTAAGLGKMWAANFAIQFIFDGGIFLGGKALADEIKKATQYSSPVSIPSKDQNPLSGAFIPSSPIGRNGIRYDKAANLIPGVGTVVNRAKEINRFVGALTGDNNN